MRKKKITIVGGGLTALTTAFEIVTQMPEARVIIVNRGKFMDEDGADEAHWRHTHVVSARGLKMLDKWFPELAGRLDVLGAPRLRWGTRDVKVTFPDGILTQKHDIGIETRSMSRGLLERQLYYEVAKHPRITIVENVELIDLVREEDLITGIDVLPLHGATLPKEFLQLDGQRAYTLDSDQVILATGFNDQWYKWLSKIGVGIPESMEVDANLTYVSADIQGALLPVGTKMFATGEKTDRAMIIANIERVGERSDISRMTVYYYNLPGRAPRTIEDLIALVATVSEEGAAYLSTVKLVGKIQVYRRCQSKIHKMWKTKNWPRNLYLIGDMILRFNPRFGQGLTVAMMAAKLLVRMMMWGDARWYNWLLKYLASFSWTLATSSDYAVMREAGNLNVPEPSFSDRMLQSYSLFLLSIAGKDENWPVAQAFFKTSNYLFNQAVGPIIMVHPRVLKIAYREWRARRAKAA